MIRLAAGRTPPASCAPRVSGDDPDLHVGGSVSLSADDVGALPADTTLSDLGYVPPTMNVPAHSHNVTISQTVPISLQFDLNTIPRAYSGTPPASTRRPSVRRSGCR